MRTHVLSIFLYACERWTLKAELERRMMRCYRKLLIITYTHHAANEMVRYKIQNANEPRYEKTGFLHICMRKQRRYIDSTIPLLSKSEILSIWPSSVTAQPSLCQTWSETPKTGFLTTRLKYHLANEKVRYKIQNANVNVS